MLVGCMPHKCVGGVHHNTQDNNTYIYTHTENVIYSALYQLVGWTVVPGQDYLQM